MIKRHLKTLLGLAMIWFLSGCNGFDPIKSFTATKFKQPDYYRTNEVASKTVFNQWQPVTIIPTQHTVLNRVVTKEKEYKKAYYFQ